MTKEEQINTLKAIIQECEEYQWQRKETLYEIIKALEKESCSDVISRENAIVRISWDFPTLEISKVKESLDKLPSVNPLPSVSPQEPKTGHWIPIQEIIGVDKEGNEISATVGYKCSKCLIVHSHTSLFCPSCGAKMIEPQSEKE